MFKPHPGIQRGQKHSGSRLHLLHGVSRAPADDVGTGR